MEPSLHVSLNVSDAARSRDFYAAFFGVDPAKVKPGYVKFVTSRPTLHLALNETGRRPDSSGSLSHLGLRVGSTSEVEAWKQRVTARGLASFDEKDTTCCYARQDKFWVTDPDGNRWEVYTVLEDVEARSREPVLLESADGLGPPDVGLALPHGASRDEAAPLPRNGADRLGESEGDPLRLADPDEGSVRRLRARHDRRARLDDRGDAPLHGATRAPEPQHDAGARSGPARRRGEPGFRVIPWEEAIDLAGERLRETRRSESRST